MGSGSSRRSRCGGCRSESCSRIPGWSCGARRCAGTGCSEQIGTGPASLAFRAIQPHVGRDVAIRIVNEGVAADPEFARRFEADAQVAAALEHPHIVPVYDYWREPGRAYVVSRYLRGGSLADLENRGERLRGDRAQRVVEQVASALAFAHRQGVVHGRLRASNILLDGEENAYIGDFQLGVTRLGRPRGRPATAAFAGCASARTWRRRRRHPRGRPAGTGTWTLR